MKILTISIDGESRGLLLQALAEVATEIGLGTDTGSYQNERRSYSYAIREYDLPGIDYEKAAYEAQNKAERARFKYLPADELMQRAGYEQPYFGLYNHRPGPGQYPVYQLSFFSQSGSCLLSRCGERHGDFETVAAVVVASDEQLQVLLAVNMFPPISPPDAATNL